MPAGTVLAGPYCSGPQDLIVCKGSYLLHPWAALAGRRQLPWDGLSLSGNGPPSPSDLIYRVKQK